MRQIITAAALMTGLAAGGAQAAVLFSEDFDDELAGNANNSQLNFNNFDQLTVTEQSVDLIKSGDFGITCETAACVDLDGSSSSGGTLTSNAFNFVGGVSYQLTVRVSGNQRNTANDTFEYGLTNGGFASATVAGGDGFTDFTFGFVSIADFSTSFFIRDLGDDNVGVIVDSITLEDNLAPVPVPAGLPLLLAGLGGLGVLRRKARKG